MKGKEASLQISMEHLKLRFYDTEWLHFLVSSSAAHSRAAKHETTKGKCEGEMPTAAYNMLINNVEAQLLIDEHATELEGLMRVQSQYAGCNGGVGLFVHDISGQMLTS